ncbi:MAG TPA: hypothetical protein VG456_15200 [Candidatus Sulfopaludibacter sp.]|jgi:hypothetical protein|nr:hypothetical protein [Candidatus Sulfopaludibacter sp.]
MRIHLIVRTDPHLRTEPGLFQACQLPAWNGLLPILTSLAAHMFVLLALATAAHQAALLAAGHLDVTKYHVEYMKLRIPDPLYYRASLPAAKAARAAKSRPAPGGGSTGSAAAGGNATASLGKPGMRIPKNLELPPVAKSIADAPLILQPPSNLEVPVTAVVPPLAFWARQDVNIPKPPPRPFIAPGRVEAPAPSPQLDAPPVLAVPNREINTSDLNMTAAVTVAAPVLPVPNATTAPVRLRDAAPDPKAGGIERQQGEAANVIAISPALVPPGQVVTIPKGQQNIPELGDGGSPGARTPAPGAPRNAPVRTEPVRSTSADASKNGTRPGAAAETPAKNVGTDPASKNPASSARSNGGRGNAGSNGPASNSGRGEAAAANGSTANGSAANGSAANGRSDTATRPAPPNASSGLSGSPNPSTAAATSAATNTGSDAVTRILHPAGGNFDVVIMQSATRADLSDVGSILTGNPVYTVYLPVGDTREWVMEYCVPAAENAKNNPYEVYVGDAAPLAAPYPIATVIPNSILGQAHRENIVFHGYLTVNGSFRNIEPRDQSALSHQIAPLLTQWKFRPALKDKVPAEIEILLVVPARI